MRVLARLEALQRHTLGHRHTAAFHHRNLARVVRHQPHRTEPHLPQQPRTQPEIAFVILEPQPVVRLDRVEPLILQRIARILLARPIPAPPGSGTEEPPPSAPSAPVRAQLRAAVALERSQHIARETGRCSRASTGRHGPAARSRSHNAPRRRHRGGTHAPGRLRRCHRQPRRRHLVHRRQPRDSGNAAKGSASGHAPPPHRPHPPPAPAPRQARDAPTCTGPAPAAEDRPRPSRNGRNGPFIGTRRSSAGSAIAATQSTPASPGTASRATSPWYTCARSVSARRAVIAISTGPAARRSASRAGVIASAATASTPTGPSASTPAPPWRRSARARASRSAMVGVSVMSRACPERRGFHTSGPPWDI